MLSAVATKTLNDEMQLMLLPSVPPFKTQLLKWVGNKQRFAHEIISYFPCDYNRYIEPFLGSGAVLGTLAPRREAIAADVYRPLIEIWMCLKNNPAMLKMWYGERLARYENEGKKAYNAIKDSFNNAPNGADLLFLCRSCYGGVVRFRQSDGAMSTPSGAHTPISLESFSERVDIWYNRIRHTNFYNQDFDKTMAMAQSGDVVYCDPPYTYCQSILYGAQNFSLERLIAAIGKCKERGVYVLLSIDGTKKSGKYTCDFHFPDGLFEREAFVNCGRSMLRRFQKDGETLEDELVSDRLLMTF